MEVYWKYPQHCMFNYSSQTWFYNPTINLFFNALQITTWDSSATMTTTNSYFPVNSSILKIKLKNSREKLGKNTFKNSRQMAAAWCLSKTMVKLNMITLMLTTNDSKISDLEYVKIIIKTFLIHTKWFYYLEYFQTRQCSLKMKAACLVKPSKQDSSILF